MAISKPVPNAIYIELLRKYKCLRCNKCEHDQMCFIVKNQYVYPLCRVNDQLIEMSTSDLTTAFGGCDKFEQIEQIEHDDKMVYGYERKVIGGKMEYNEDIDVSKN